MRTGLRIGDYSFMGVPKRRIIPLFIPHYGCKYDCVYCDQRLISGQSVPVTPEYVRNLCCDLMTAGHKEMNAGSERPPPVPMELAFYGGSFTAIPEKQQIELLEAARFFIESNPLNSIRVSTRPDCIDVPTVARLKSFHVGVIELGAQSMCGDVLASTRRGHTAVDVELAADIVKSAGVSLILQMMTGLPHDTYERSLFTARRLIELVPDGVRIYPVVVVRGTALYDMWLRGQYREHSVAEAVELCSELYALFDEANIPVIRMGLNPSDSLTKRDAAAGAYHPAFGELVYSKIYYKKAAALLEGVPPLSDISITVSSGNLSKMIGFRRQNIDSLKNGFSLRTLKIAEADIKPGEIMIEKISQ